MERPVIVVLAALACGAVLCTLCTAAGAQPSKALRVVITNHTIGHVSPLLFGQFMERASWGEPGPEAARVPGTRQLQPSVLARLEEMRIPIIRFPGGTDADYTDWRDLIDNVPGREGPRPIIKGVRGGEIGSNFGYDEFLRLCQGLKTQSLLVVNLGDALLRRKPLKEAAAVAAGLVAYCNAAEGAPLPTSLPDWPAVRARNGHPKPYGVHYFQVGNETWAFWDDMKALGLDDGQVMDWYLTCVEAYVDAMRAVDPSIAIIVDANGPDGPARIRARLGDRVQYLTHHHYCPWRYSETEKDGQPYPIENMTAEEIWNAWVATPDIDPSTGLSTDPCGIFEEAPRAGYQVAVTEWNWNGSAGHGRTAPFASSFAKGIGAAGFLHAYLRRGDTIALGCQSMLVGVNWPIHAIRADRTGREPAYYMPTGQVTMFYSQHHGPDLLEVSAEPSPRFPRPYSMGNMSPKPKGVAALDAVVTARADRLFLHVINRSFTDDMAIAVELQGFKQLSSEGVQHCFEGRLRDEPEPGQPRQVGSIRSLPVTVEGSTVRVTPPKRSVSIIEVPCER
jgi:alpha-N-arabinofuranosidase